VATGFSQKAREIKDFRARGDSTQFAARFGASGFGMERFPGEISSEYYFFKSEFMLKILSVWTRVAVYRLKTPMGESQGQFVGSPEKKFGESKNLQNVTFLQRNPLKSLKTAKEKFGKT
jgi:hypothetical protein